MFSYTSQAQTTPFWWGVGNASFQVEGAPADSDWSQWVRQPGNVADGTNADQATGFWKDPEKDFDLAQKLGAKMFRLSIAWERVEPIAYQWDEVALARYESMIVQLRKRGIEPMVTLHHFVLPAWLAKKGGLTSPEFADHFAAYALKVVRRLALGPAQVKWWMTFNEPMVLVFAGYVTGEWPPNVRSLGSAAKAEAGIARAHLKALKAIRAAPDLPSDLKFSVATHWRDFQAQGFWFLNSAIARFTDWIFNRQLVDSLVSGKVLVWIPGAWPKYENIGLPAKGAPLDYLGINYYGRNVIHPQWKPPFVTVDEGQGATTDVGWVIYPEGLGHVLANSYAAYALPILISENGIADARDAQRGEFLRQHVAQIQEARQKKIPVIGYLHWSLTDNFEWAKGFTPRFGLVEMDYRTGERKPRPSFQVYKEIIKNTF